MSSSAVTYRIYGCEEPQEARYETALDGYEKAAVRANVRQSALPPLYLAVSNIGVLFILWFGGKKRAGHGMAELEHCGVHHVFVLFCADGRQILQGSQAV